MKLSNVSAKLTSGKATGLFTGIKMLGGLVLAGAALTLTAPAAQAQAWGVGVQIGGPRYVAPAPVYGEVYGGGYGPAYVAPRYGYAPEYWQERRAEAWRAQMWREHEYRAHEFWGYRHGYYGRPY